MSTVGVRDLKAKLSEHLRRVERGEIVTVTDRGRPVARIVPASLPEGLARMIQEGRVRWSGKRAMLKGRGPRNRGRRTLSDIVIADRG